MPPSPKPLSSVGFVTRHHKYYIESADLHVVTQSPGPEAKRTLFRIHSYFFSRESSIFNRKVNPASPGEAREGSTEADPVILEGIDPYELEKFLWVFYNPSYSIYDTSVADWQIILKLADNWGFSGVKDLAVRELHKKDDLPLLDRMALYQNYHVDPKHLIPLYAELCSRDTPLSLDESKILGLETTVLISNARETLRAKPSAGGKSPLPDGLDEYDVFRALEGRLGVEMGSTADYVKKNPAPPSKQNGPLPNANGASSGKPKKNVNGRP